jgi:anti-anti-sigma regulatory factor
VLRSFKPRLTEIGWLPGTDVFVDRARYPQAVLIPGVILYRVDGDIHYGNVDAVTSLLQKTLNLAIERGAASLLGREDDRSLGGKNSDGLVDLYASEDDGDDVPLPSRSHEDDGDDVPLPSRSHEEAGHMQEPAEEKRSAPPPERRPVAHEGSQRRSGLRVASMVVKPSPAESVAGSARRRASFTGVPAELSRDDEATGPGSVVVKIPSGDDDTIPSSNRSQRGDTVTSGSHRRDPQDHLSLRIAKPDTAFVPPPRWYTSTNVSPIPIDTAAAEKRIRPTPSGMLRRRKSRNMVKATRKRLEADRIEMLSHNPLKAVIIDCSRVSGIDLSACQEIHDLVQLFAQYNIMLLLAAIPGHVRDVVERFGVLDPLDELLNPPGTTTAERRRRRFITIIAAVERVVERHKWPSADAKTLAVTADNKLPLAVMLSRLQSVSDESTSDESSDNDAAAQAKRML